MEHNAIYKFGGTFSILLAITTILVAAVYVLLPSEQQDACQCADRFLVSLAQNPILYIAEYALFGVYSLLGTAAVLAISENVRSVNEGWVRWTSSLAIVGFAVNAVDALRSMALNPVRAVAYVQGGAAVKAALTVPGALQGLDPQAWLRLGAVGLWVGTVSLLGLRSNAWPRLLAYLGIAVTVVYWLVVAGQVLQLPSLIVILAGAGGVLFVPIWYMWLGLRLRRAT